MIGAITIRTFANQDKEAILNLFQLNTPAYFSEAEEKDLLHYLENEIELYFVIEVDHKIVGSGGINFSDDRRRAKISWDLLHPDFHRKSLGTKLLKHRLNLLEKINGLESITVRTSQLAYSFYEKFGFKLKEVVKDYWAEGFDLYRMEL